MSRIKVNYKVGKDTCTEQSLEVNFDICNLPVCCNPCLNPVFEANTIGCIEEINDVNDYYRIELNLNISCGALALDWSNLTFNDVNNLDVTIEHDTILNKYYLRILKTSWSNFINSTKNFNVDILDCGIVSSLSYTNTENWDNILFCNPCVDCNVDSTELIIEPLCFYELDALYEVSPLNIALDCVSGTVVNPNYYTVTLLSGNCSSFVYFENGRWYIKRTKNCTNFSVNLSVCWDNCEDSLVIPTCDTLLISDTGDIYSYHLATSGYITQLAVPSLLTPTTNSQIQDIAHTTTKMWVLRGNDVNFTGVIREWDITLNPYTCAFNRDIIMPTNTYYGAGLFALNNTTLIGTIEDNFGNESIVEWDITTINAVLTTKFALPNGYYVLGDMLVTTTGEILMILGNGTNNSYLYNYDYATGSINYNFMLPIAQLGYGIFIKNNNIYVVGDNGGIFLIDVSTQTAQQVAGSAPNLNGSSSILSCNIL